jgi:uncharacterized protein
MPMLKPSTKDLSRIGVQRIVRRLPNVLSIYLFGSRAADTDNPDSDLDLAVLVAGYADTLALWNLSSEIANEINCDVDLLDMRAASTVLQYQILSKGIRIWESAEPHIALDVGLYECAMLSDMTTLNEARAGLIADIQKSGSVYGR